MAGPRGNLTRFPILPKKTGAPEAQNEIEKIDVLEALRYHGTGKASTRALNTFEVAMLTLGVDDSSLFWSSLTTLYRPAILAFRLTQLLSQTLYLRLSLLKGTRVERTQADSRHTLPIQLEHILLRIARDVR